MAEEPQKPAAAPQVAASDVPKPEETTPAAATITTTTEKDAPPAAPEPTPELAEQKEAAEGEAAEAAVADDPRKITQTPSFKEESNVVSELPETQRKALDDFKKLIQEALNKHEFTAPPTPVKEEKKTEETKKEEEAKTEEPKADDPAAAAAAAASSEEKKEEVSAPAPAPASDAAPTPAPDTKVEKAPAAAVEPPKTEELKKEAAKSEPAVVEAPKTEEPKKEEQKSEPAVVEAPKTEEPKKEEKKPEPAAEPKPEPTLAAAEPEKKTTVTEEDTSKTVEEKIISECPPEAPKTEEVKAEESNEVAPKEEEPVAPIEPEEVFLWGIPILGDIRSDTVLLKFLRARDFKVKEAFAMIKKCVRWRKVFGVDSLLEEELGTDYEKVVFTHGVDKEGREVVYNVFGEFQDKELYQMTFADAEKQKKFLRWLVQFLEKTIRRLDFSPTGISSFVIVNDLKDSPGYGKREFSKVINKYLHLLQDNYPEFVAKQVCINVSWWYFAYAWVYISVFTPRSRSKFVFSGSSKAAETLFKYIAPEHVPVQYGGHSRTGELEFSPEDPVTEVTLKPGSKHPIEFEFTEKCTIIWELRVVGWDVTYEAQYVPTEGYTVLVSKPKKMNPTDDPLVCESFKVNESGKLVITVDNQSHKKKKLLYRSKVKTSSE